jgi:antitoxin FitA
MVMVQIRHVPEELHRELRARAAREGHSLSEFLLAELVRIGSRPTLDMLADRIRARDVAPPRSDQPIVEMITQGRDEHDAVLEQRTRRD